MQIGIIGAGNIGGTLTQRLAALGHVVSVANSRGPETLRELAAETGATAVSVTEAARDKDLVVVTVPEKKLPDLPSDLFAATGVVVVDTVALPVAGDDDSAKAVVMQLIDELGFDAVDTGGLDESWRQQPGTPVYTTDLDADGVRRALSEASPERAPQWRAAPNSPGSVTDPR
jgi:predicted dinucleotide-binding enzyme